MTKPRLPFPLNLAMIAAGAVLVGHGAATEVANPETIVQGKTRTEWQTRVITRRIRGHVRVLPGGTQVVVVHQFIVRTDSHTITVPQQTLPVTRLHGATVAGPIIPVTVTVSVPTTVTDTVTVTTTETDIVPTTITVSVPNSPTTSDQGGTTNANGLHRPIQRERSRRLLQGSRHASLPQGHRRRHVRRQHLRHPAPPSHGGGR